VIKKRGLETKTPAKTGVFDLMPCGPESVVLVGKKLLHHPCTVYNKADCGSDYDNICDIRHFFLLSRELDYTHN
jgi:hypothetical protein